MKRLILLVLFILLISQIAFTAVSVTVSDQPVTVGDVVEVTFTVTDEPAVVPSIQNAYSDHIRLIYSDITAVSDNASVMTLKLVLFRTGTFSNVLENPSYMEFPDVTIRVASLLTDNVTGISDIKGLEQWPEKPSYVMYWMAGFGVVILLIVLGVWLKFRKGTEPTVHVETAAERLADVVASGVSGTVAVAALSEIVRMRLSEIHHTDYLCRSTDEMVAEIGNSMSADVVDLLQMADNVKFAGAPVSDDDVKRYTDVVSKLMTEGAD